MAPSTLYLGPLTSVDSSGNLDFTSAVLRSGDSTLSTKKYVDDLVTIINSNIDFIKSNTDPAQLDSLTEIVQRAVEITAALDAEVATRAAADSAEQAARIAADNAEQAARIAAVSAEESARVAAVAAEEAARVAADNAEQAARIAADTAEANARIAGDLAEQTARLEQDIRLKSLDRRSMINMPMDVSVYADAQKPFVKETQVGLNAATSAYDGWYYTNLALGNKINWYVPTTAGLRNQDIYALYLHLHVVNTVSTPFLTVYTKPRAGFLSAANGSTWYKCRKTYLANSASLSALGNYTFVVPLATDSNLYAPAKHGHSRVDLALDEQSSRYRDVNTQSVDLPDDEILFFSVGTNSGAAAGNVKFVLSGVDIQTATGIYPFNFSNVQVLEKFNVEKMQALYSYFFNKNILGDDSAFLPSNV